MEVTFKVVYHPAVVRTDIPALSKSDQRRIRQAVEQKLMQSPEVFGKPLRRSLKGYRKLRVGDYRVIFRIQDNVVKVFAILHRSVVYSEVEKRL